MFVIQMAQQIVFCARVELWGPDPDIDKYDERQQIGQS